MQPNIIIMNCDDLGYGDLSCYGSKKNDTPTLDALAESGIRFTDFYSASPLCSPSRASLMTGCYPPRVSFGMFGEHAVLMPGHDIGLNPNESTMAKTLKSVGYNTMLVGKWHCGDQKEFLPTRHGFDHYYGLPYSNDMGRQASSVKSPLPLMDDENVLQLQPDQTSLTERYVEQCVKFIRKNSENPFFLYFAHMHVHLPLYVADRFIKSSRNGNYGAAVSAIDWSMDVIIHELKSLGLYENTIIVFTSDNGSRNDFGESNGPLRGEKGSTWEGGQRVPLIVSWPKVTKAGQTKSGIITMMDLYPSLAEAAGANLSGDTKRDGIEMQSYLLGDGQSSPREVFFYYWLNELEAVRCGDWKLHVRKKGKDFNALYNLNDDIGEKANVIESYPDIAQKLSKLMDEIRCDIGDAALGIKGKNIRPAGKVANPKPLAEYDPKHPYIISMYDCEDFG